MPPNHPLFLGSSIFKLDIVTYLGTYKVGNYLLNGLSCQSVFLNWPVEQKDLILLYVILLHGLTQSKHKISKSKTNKFWYTIVAKPSHGNIFFPFFSFFKLQLWFKPLQTPILYYLSNSV